MTQPEPCSWVESAACVNCWGRDRGQCRRLNMRYMRGYAQRASICTNTRGGVLYFCRRPWRRPSVLAARDTRHQSHLLRLRCMLCLPYDRYPPRDNMPCYLSMDSSAINCAKISCLLSRNGNNKPNFIPAAQVLP
jgi:hypothetical protein